MDEYTVAWAACSFIAGAGAGILLCRQLAGGWPTGGPRTPIMRRGFEWARRDIVIPEPTAQATTVRNVSHWQDDGQVDLDGRTFTFHLHDERTDLDRDATLSAHQVMSFYKCDTPARSEWHGDVKVYTLLLAVGKSYNWLTRRSAGNGYEWSIPFGTRERRLRRISMWMATR